MAMTVVVGLLRGVNVGGHHRIPMQDLQMVYHLLSLEYIQTFLQSGNVLHLRGSHLYLYFPNGMARPKLTTALLERTLEIPGTARSWNTVLKLADLCRRLATS